MKKMLMVALVLSAGSASAQVTALDQLRALAHASPSETLKKLYETGR